MPVEKPIQSGEAVFVGSHWIDPSETLLTPPVPSQFFRGALSVFHLKHHPESSVPVRLAALGIKKAHTSVAQTLAGTLPAALPRDRRGGNTAGG